MNFSVENELPKALLEIFPKAAACLEILFAAIQSKQQEPQEFLGIYNQLLINYLNILIRLMIILLAELTRKTMIKQNLNH